METYFSKQVQELYEKSLEIISHTSMLKAIRTHELVDVEISQDFKEAFFRLIDKVSLSLMEEKDNFYGYFFFQMGREIRFDISSPSAVNFKGAKYVIYFNPIIFLTLNIKQMETTIKHEIHHILSMHLIRARELKGRYATRVLNMAMDIVVNKYLDYLPPYATTLKQVNIKYGLQLEPYEPFEYYAEKLQIAFDLLEEDEEGEIDDSYNPESTHDLWEESDEIDEKTLKEFTQKFITHAQKGSIPAHLEGMIASLKSSKGELPWNLYLSRLMGTVESNKKKTITRRNRRQPERLDLRGQLRNHKAEIAVAVDISGSMSQEEFNQAIKEVLHIVKNYNHEITLIECDDQIRCAYKVKSVRDVQERRCASGGTRFTPVFDYANKKNINLLIYFTDGKGEEKLQVIPRGYKVLWVISGRGDSLSLKESYGAVKKLSKIEIKDTSLEMSDVRSDGYSMNNQAPIF
ncbi:MAG: VWA-like domain-containing protein [Zhenhengia sp.]|uniref:vWA domain-containing protein n=1 Tax=Zhenhengia sp. TaxID=2944208 RepID=UPI003994E61D